MLCPCIHHTVDLSQNRLNLTQDNHLCFSLNIYPLVDRAGSVRLIPPLPDTGVIMTGFTGTGDGFSLYLEDRVLKLDFVPFNGSLLKLRVNQMLDLLTSYQIDIELGMDQIELRLATISGSVSTEIVQLTGNLTTSFVNGVFTTICVGGTMLELPYYGGIVERVIFNRAPLSDQSYMGSMSQESQTDVISFKDGILDPPLQFRRLTFANFLSLSFEIRMEMDSFPIGVPLKSRLGGGDDFSFSLLNNRFALFGVLDVNNSVLGINNSINLFITCPFNQPEINDNRWHHVSLTLIRFDNGSANFNMIVDKDPSHACRLERDEDQSNFGKLLDESVSLGSFLEFGVSDTVNIFGPGPPSSERGKFVGCFKNMEFRRTANSPPVRPDFASLIKTVGRFGSGDSCYGCVQSMVRCQGGEVCVDCGFSEADQCQPSPGGVCSQGEREMDNNMHVIQLNCVTW